MGYTGDDSGSIDRLNEIDSRCVVKFRPADGWKGEFGFDWFREGDYGEKDHNDAHTNKSHYKNDELIGKYGCVDSHGNFNLKDPDQGDGVNIDENQIDNSRVVINADSYAKQYYSPIPIKTPIKDRIVNSFATRGVKSNKQNVYYVPSISHSYESNTKDEEITIKLNIHAENILLIDFYVEEGTKGVKLNPSSIMIDGDYDKDDKELTIILTKDFKYGSGDFSISVVATHKSQFFSSKLEQTLAGKINVVNYNPKQINLVFVSVRLKTDAETDTETETAVSKPDSSVLENEKKNLCQFLSQAFIIPEMPSSLFSITLEHSEYAYYERDFNYYENGVFINTFQGIHRVRDNFISVLINKFNSKYDSYRDYYKVFFVEKLGLSGPNNIPCSTLDGNYAIAGHGFDIPSKDAVIFDPSSNSPDVVCHELLHCLGLYHSFSNRNTFTFKQGNTSDIMDYPSSYKQISLWKWQWEEMRNDLPLKYTPIT